MNDFSGLFSALSGAGAAFVALTGGLVLQRLVSLQAEVSGRRLQFHRADADVLAAHTDLERARDEGARIYAQLVASDDEFLNELYGNVARVLNFPQESSGTSLAVRQSRLASLLTRQATERQKAQDEMMSELWTYAVKCMSAAKPWINEVSTSRENVFTTIGKHPRPVNETAWFDADLVWRAMSYRLGQDEHADVHGGVSEDYVPWRSHDGRNADEIGQALSSLRDGLNRRHRERSQEDERAAQARLEERKTVRAQISVPVFDQSLWWEGAITLFLMVTMLIIPVLHLTPGPGEPPGPVRAVLVTLAFLIGACAYLAYCFVRGRALLQATKPPTPSPIGPDPSRVVN